jgi:membrane protein implicated in regulation of membrane protease activity
MVVTEQPIEATGSNTNAGNKALLSNRTYDILKPTVSLIFPAILAFYATLSQIWKWPYEVQITATLAAVQVLLGVVFTVASKLYGDSEDKYDGDIVVTKEGAIAKVAGNTGFVAPGAKDAVFKVTRLP